MAFQGLCSNCGLPVWLAVLQSQIWDRLAFLSKYCDDLLLQATLYVYEMKGSDMAVTKIEHPDPSLES